MHAKNLQIIRQFLLRDTSCLLHYLVGAWPWSNRKEQEIIRRLEHLQAEESEEHSRLASVLRKQRLVPPAPSYLSEYSSCHFLALDYLLPRVLEEQKQLLASHQTARLQTVGDPEAEAVLDAFLTHKQKHMAELESILSDHTALKVHSTVR